MCARQGEVRIARRPRNCYILGAMLKCAVYLDMRDNRWWRTGQHIPETPADFPAGA